VGAILPAARDCRSAADNDCDGLPDNRADSVCQCVPNATEQCDEHAGRDGFGICRAGTRRCIASAGFLSSNWGVCEGAIAPRARNCTSSADNDCDGLPDDTVDDVCQCRPGAFRFCADLPIPAAGLPDFRGCGTGTSLCDAGPGSSSSTWTDCECAAGEHCATPFGACDLPELGRCAPPPEEGRVCAALFDPVCGCDGHTYGNSCSASNAGASIDFDGACDAPASQ
jgi:hypothetical protein